MSVDSRATWDKPTRKNNLKDKADSEPIPRVRQMKRGIEYITLYRAQKEKFVDSEIHPFMCFSQDKEVAEAYTDNPGFGGKHLVKLHVEDGDILDITTKSGTNNFEKLAQELNLGDTRARDWGAWGYRYPWEESKEVWTGLENSSYKFLRYSDDFPEGATTIIPLKKMPIYEPEVLF